MAGTSPLHVIANVSRVVTRVVDRLTGDRVDYPLLVASACVEGLKAFGIGSRIMYGQVAWIEVLEDQSLIWAGCWGENVHFWVETEFGEVIDLNTSVAHRKRAPSMPDMKALYSPPILWSVEVPSFYRYKAEGIAELELTEQKDVKILTQVLDEVRSNCGPSHSGPEGEPTFPNEAILCPDRRVLDDSRETFRHFDRALGVRGIPEAPF